jgi:hypothetical protein
MNRLQSQMRASLSECHPSQRTHCPFNRRPALASGPREPPLILPHSYQEAKELRAEVMLEAYQTVSWRNHRHLRACPASAESTAARKQTQAFDYTVNKATSITLRRSSKSFGKKLVAGDIYAHLRPKSYKTEKERQRAMKVIDTA